MRRLENPILFHRMPARVAKSRPLPDTGLMLRMLEMGSKNFSMEVGGKRGLPRDT